MHQKTCSIDGCTSRHSAKGMCRTHYRRVRSTGQAELVPRMPRMCEVADCHSPMVARGYCSMHWQRWRHHGDPLTRLQGGPNARDIRERFEEKYLRAGDDECWEWRGTVSQYGYGVIQLGIGNQEKAHRLAYLFDRGEIAPAALICHTCDNRSCVNPRHLYAGTIQDNNFDRWHGGPSPRPNPEVHA